MADEDEIAARVAEFLELRDTASGPTLDEFIARFPEIKLPLREAISDAASAMDALVSGSTDYPREIGGYRIRRILGTGGMGVVFEADDVASNRRVAVKCIHWGNQISARARERFAREAEALSRLQHPGIVSILKSGEHEGAPFLVMQFVDGPKLSTLLGTIEERRAVELVRELALAVRFAHENGVLHRDIKPENVILQSDGRPVLVDFGLAGVTDATTITRSGDLLGTPRYMAPEQLCGSADERTDIYGLGLVLLSLLGGSVVRGGTPRPRNLIPGLSNGLDAILQTALAWNPARRYSSATDFAADLECYVSGKTIAARPLGVSARALEFVQRCPVIAASGALAIALTVTLIITIPPWLERRAQARAEVVADRLDRAVFHWIRGDLEGARTIAAEIQQSIPGERTAAALLTIDNPDTEPPGGTVLREIVVARRAAQSGARDEAVRILTIASQRWPRSLAIAEDRSRMLYDLRRNTDAASECERALAMEANDIELLHRLARARFREKQIVQALDAARRAADLCKKPDPTIHNTLAAILDANGRGSEAREILRQIVDTNPDRAAPQFNLAFSFDKAGKTAEAVPYYKRCLELDPENTSAPVALAWIYATSDDAALRSFDLAEATILNTLRRDRGRTSAVLKTAVDIAKRTGRSESLRILLDEITNDEPIDEKRLGSVVAAKKAISSESKNR